MTELRRRSAPPDHKVSRALFQRADWLARSVSFAVYRVTVKRSIKGLRVRERGRMEDKLSGCPGKRRRTLKSGPRASVCPFIRWPDGTTTHAHSSGPIPFSQGVAKRFMSSEMGLLRHGSLIYVPRCYPPFCFACFIFGWQSTAPVFEAGRGPGGGFNLLRGPVVP